MKGIQKLKIAVAVLFIMSISLVVFSYWLGAMEDENTYKAFNKAYDEMVPQEQSTINDFYNKFELKDYSAYYSIIGWLMIALAVGLFILLVKLLKIEKI